jgi:hypothetical protein
VLLFFFLVAIICFFIAIAFLSVGIASYNYYRYSPFVFLTLILFFVQTFLYRDINQVRSAITEAISLFLIANIHNRKHFKVILIICVAGFFHVASFSLIIVYLFSFLRLTRVMLVFGYFFALFLGIIGVSSVMLSFMPNLGFIKTKLVNYANSGYADSVSLFDITNVKNSFIFLMLIIYWRHLVDRVKYFEKMILFCFVLFCFVSVTWRIAFSDFAIFAARIATFFGVVEVLLIPSLIYIFKQRVIATCIILLYAFVTLYLNLFVKEGRYPYELSFSFFRSL